MTVTRRALAQRINRKLRLCDAVLRVARGEATPELGQYYLFDLTHNRVVLKDCDLESLGRQLNVLAESERLLR